jgi:hypothetical protein
MKLEEMIKGLADINEGRVSHTERGKVLADVYNFLKAYQEQVKELEATLAKNKQCQEVLYTRESVAYNMQIEQIHHALTSFYNDRGEFEEENT